jgi:KaiC/GvpD/RAD55 family RecA-like ATPase
LITETSWRYYRMEIHELNALSPLRAFDESLNGGLGKGNLGVLVSRHGIGKTACLVHLATDKLFRNEHIIHVSFSGNVEHVINWYKEVFRQISDGRSLEDAAAIYNEILSNRVVMNFSQENVSIDKVLSSLETLIRQGSFNADAVMFDGYKLTIATEEDVQKIKKFAMDMRIEAWFSVSPVRADVTFDENGVPSTILKYVDLIDVLIGLKYNEAMDKVIMTLVKDKETVEAKPMRVTLDPKTMLISE